MEEKWNSLKITKFGNSLNCLKELLLLVVNGFTKPDETHPLISNDTMLDLLLRVLLLKKGIDYHETFSLVSKKDSFRIIMAMIPHMDLDLHQMDVNRTFLNEDLKEEVYMYQEERFSLGRKVNYFASLKS